MPGAGATTGKGRFVVTLDWRRARATEVYLKTRKNHDLTNALKPIENLSILNVSGTYGITPRTSLTATLPVVFNSFSLLLPPQSILSQRYTLNARGIGDVNIVARHWLLKQKEHPFHNLQMGIGLKLPTGNWKARDTYPNIDGLGASRKTAFPPAILPGDGGVGVIVDAQAYKTFRRPEILRGSSVFASAAYLINPKDTNSGTSVITGLGLFNSPLAQNALFNSVADTYAVQFGYSMPIPGTQDYDYLKGLRFLAVGRYEGLKQKDIFGRSDGWRQPGNILTVGPAVAWSFGKNYFAIEVPITYQRRIDADNAILPGGPLRTFGTAAPVSIALRYSRSL